MVSKTKRRGIVSGADKFEATIKEAAAQAKVGVVVPTGFEPVFKP
jgi:tRNA-binding EMAP/Myf-like protein